MKHLVNGTLIATALAVIFGAAISVQAQRSADAEYKRLVALGKKLEKIPIDKQDREPHKSFIKRNTKDIVYSDPAGQWFVRADRFWNLAKRNRTLPLADDIAWTAANTPLPGECEGDMNCSLYYTKETAGEYLRLFPSGKYSEKALADLVESFSSMSAPDAKAGYTVPTDASENAEFQKSIAELRGTLIKVPGHGKDKAVAELDKLANTYK